MGSEKADTDMKLICIEECCMRINFENLFGFRFQSQLELARETSDGYVYVAGTVIPDYDVHVKIGHCSRPMDRIRDFNCASPSLYTGEFFLVRDCEFWEATVLNILNPFRLHRYYGSSEIINGRKFLNGIEGVIRTWEPDGDALAWIYHLYRVISIRASFPKLSHGFMNDLACWAPNCDAMSFMSRSLELFGRELSIGTKSQCGEGEEMKQYEGILIYDK